MTNKVKISTIARVAALIVALVNQVLALFGRGSLPFTENFAYQLISVIVTIIVVLINAWYNNDFTKAAIMSGKIFDALKDGKLTEEELQAVLTAGEASDESLNATAQTVVNIANKTAETIKEKIGSEE